VLGYGDLRIMITQLLPNMLGPIIVIGTLGMAARYWPKPHCRSLASESATLSKLGQHAVGGPRPAHPYTQTLIAAIPDPLRRAPLATTKGEPPNPLSPPDGCAFSPRCRHAEAVCHREPGPSLETRPDGHSVRCWRADEIAGRALASTESG